MSLTKVTTNKCLHPLSRIGHCEYVIHFVHMKCAPLHITNVTCWRHGTLVVDVAQALVEGANVGGLSLGELLLFLSAGASRMTEEHDSRAVWEIFL